MLTMSSLMLKCWGALLKKFEAFIQSLPVVVEYNPTSQYCERLFTRNNSFLSYYNKRSWGFLTREDNGQWVPICLPVPSMAKKEYGQGVAVGEELGQEATSGFGVGANKQNKANTPIPPKAKATKEKEMSHDSDSDESSWGDPNPKLAASNKGLGLIPILGDDKVLPKFEEAKKVEALAVNMEEALANPEVPELVKKVKVSEVLPQKPSVVSRLGKWASWVRSGLGQVYGSPTGHRLKYVDPNSFLWVGFRSGSWVGLIFAMPSCERRCEGFIRHPQHGEEAYYSKDSVKSGDTEGVNSCTFVKTGKCSCHHRGGKGTSFQGNIDINKAGLEEFESDVSDAVKKSIFDNSKVDIDKPTMSLVKKAASFSEIKHSEQPSLIPAKSSEADDFAMKLIKNLDEMNDDRDVSLALFGLVPLGGSRVVGGFTTLAMLEVWALHLLDTFPNLTTCRKAKKVVVEDTFAILYAAMRHMKVTTFIEMNEDFFYLCRDAIDDVESINSKVDVICTHLSNLAKAYIRKTRFNMTKGDTAEKLDDQIKEQMEHVAKMEKSLAETKGLVFKLEERLVSAKAYLESFNQEKELVASSGLYRGCQGLRR
ncbi:hypothetical protein SLEP1_g44139 [Rubroshorea leprosula]|uniref:Uncharacterized protein n=1 Tax=Rubroshorea leprosula TaxID=152421 RepID=A0AAV5LF99_9ROSI|nr:hypothetical protein SLEP1_g44139 [Rubroshorea leprosula]